VPGDPKECWMRAARCAELAMTARTPQLKMRLLELSKTWEKLALELEHFLVIIDKIEITSSDVHQSVGVAIRVSNLPGSGK
jgi:hypothetical protein